jgi:hypothetical protein
MNRFLGILVLTHASTTAYAQFRPERAGEPSRSTMEAMVSEPSWVSELFNPDRWSTRQTYSFSYSQFGGASIGLTSFTNSFIFKAAENVRVSADVAMIYSPFSSFGGQSSKALNGIYLSNAQLDWQLDDKTYLQIQYSGLPALYPFQSQSSLLNNFGLPRWETSSASITH